MPIVTISVWEEFGQDRARQLIKGITDSFVQVGIPAQAVQVVIHEVPRSHWGDGGRVASERSGQRDAAPRNAGAASDRGRRSERPARSQSGSRQNKPSRRQGPSRTDTRPGHRPRRGGSGSR